MGLELRADLDGVEWNEHSMPNFANEEEERIFWQTHDSTDHIDWSAAQQVSLPKLRPTLKSISLRLP